MPPKPEGSNGAEITTTSGNNDADAEKVSFKDRMTNRITNLIASLRLFIYDKEHQTILGNTSESWIKISVYYCLFYICLGLFYSGMVAVFGAIISREEPTYWYHNNQMNDDGKLYIGMGFRPMPDIADVSLTVYNDTKSQNDTIASLRLYQTEYLTQYDTTYLQDCSPTEPASQLQGSRSCRFSWTDIVTTDSHPCSVTNMFGWPAGKPCVLIKLNKVYGWVPGNGSIINKVESAINQTIPSVDKRESNIFITCNGKDAVDKDLIGNMTYYSLLHPLGNPYYGGLPYYFYPYMNSKQYVEPFVLVRFTSLPLYTLVTVECRAWAPNIEQLSEGTASHGIVTFNLYKSNQNRPQNTN